MSGDCPQCGEELVVVKAGDTRARACRTCGGLWLSWAAVDRVMRALDDTSLAIGQAADDIAEVPFPPHRASPPCPECSRPMRTVVNPKTKIEIENCEEHGSWYDRGELRTVIRTLVARSAKPIRLPDDFHERLAMTPSELEKRLRDEFDADRVEFVRRQTRPQNPLVNQTLDATQDAAIGAAVEIGFDVLLALLSSRD